MRLHQRKQSLRVDVMETKYAEGELFEKKDFTQIFLQKGEYEQCTFKKCDFSNSDLSEIRFGDCTFTECNLSMASLANIALQNVTFRNCKMLGMAFKDLNYLGFNVYFEDCILNQSSFYKAKLGKTTFKNSKLHEVIFSECNLKKSIFDGCDLFRTAFEQSILEQADFRTSYNYSINPDNNRMKKALFSRDGVVGLLDQYDIIVE